ncbi:MAG: DNA topoisomerase (ATP-hydrolyzing) [Lachnospiraceae bacterium]|nr:DNA topoisomerase (ATP-hydrolyzing) [Lachnospiraceae bacterium]
MARKSEEVFEEQIIKTEYSDVMQKSYIDYAMSVLMARAVPDVRDGLKPVQRRVLYAMHELGLKYDKPYRKSARIVGDAMGKYHPHGDSSIYEALVVMAQDFKKGMALVDGHGNFGSIEGDGAAAMRYTEARLRRVTQEALLADLDKDVVDFVPNFDETEKEPSVLPAKIPNLLVNGTEGIAVGMTTSMPPHNLGEVIEGIKAYMHKPEITVAELMEYIQGPDFPTGGIVTNKDELLSIYETGSGKIKIRGNVEIEQGKAGKMKIVVTEIPYTMIGANIGKFLTDIVGLIDSKKTSDIVDISNQSSKDGIRIVVEVKKDANVENLKNMLIKKTKLEDTFGVNMLAVADGRPETLSLKDIIVHHVNFQRELNTRKYNTLLKKELDKKEIQEGLIKACDVIDLIIEIIRGSKEVKIAKRCLVEGITEGINFKSRISKKQAELLRFTERQAQAILDLRLSKLVGLEIEALIKEHDTTLKNIEKYKDILTNPKTMDKTIIKELDDIKKEFAVERKTRIENLEEATFGEKKIEEAPVYFLMDRFGYARMIDVPTYERNKDTIETENKYVIPVLNSGRICIFTSTGDMHTVKMMDLPLCKMKDKGVPIDNVSNFDSTKEDYIYLCTLNDVIMQKLMFVTKQGMMKQVYGTEFDVLKRTVAATKLSDGDSVISVEPIIDQRTVALITKDGFVTRFAIDEVPLKKKGAVGVRGMKLSPSDEVTNVFYMAMGDNPVCKVKGRNIEVNKIKLTKRDTKGTKLRG